MDLSEVRASQVRHPWETARAVAIERILRGARVQPQRILDYGCGDGFSGERVLGALHATQLLGFDINLTDEQCRTRSRERVSYTNDWQQADRRAFDLALLCDVIEHVEDDRALLGVVREHLSDGGHALVTVPAFQSLFTLHDRALRHFRRYSLPQLEGVIAAAGFDLVGSGFLFASLLPPRGLAKLIESAKPKQETEDFGIGAWSGSSALTRATEAMLNWDNSLLLALASRGIKLPGLSAWALCKKRPS
ncbi:MAG: class I SAM-dependent methyltransferase [Myxococcales bacterium]